MDKNPSFKVSMVTVTVIMLILILGIFVIQTDIHILLLIALGSTFVVAKYLKYSFDEVLNGMAKSIAQAMPAMMIFVMIGVIISSWIISGTVPGIIYYGLQIIKPGFFLPVGLLLCSVTSLAIGTSWGTAGTVGVALMGMGQSLGIPAPITAGMVLSGAYFGDKMSPVSDTTNLSATAAKANLYDHIKSMSYATVPSYILSFIIFAFIGLRYANNIDNSGNIELIIETLGGHMNMNIIVFLPMIVLFALNIKKVPAIPAMMFGSIIAIVIAISVQKIPFRDALIVLNYGYVANTGVEIVDNLLSRGGIQSMMWTFSLAFIAISLGGVLQKIKVLSTLVEGFISKINNPGLIATVVIMTTTMFCALLGEVYLAIILSGNLYSEEFEKKGIKASMLSRFLEEGGTLTQIFVPWTTGAAFMASTLGVSTLEYAPYAFLNYINPIISIALSFAGLFFFTEGTKVLNVQEENHEDIGS